MGLESRTMVVENYSDDVVNKQMLEIYGRN